MAAHLLNPLCYKLRPGQELFYRLEPVGPSQTDDAHPVRSSATALEWDVIVLSRDKEDRWQLMFEQATVPIAPIASEANASSTTFSDDGYCCIDAKGHIEETWTLRASANLTLVFPVLPASIDAAIHGWTSSCSVDAAHRRFCAVKPNLLREGQLFCFEEIMHTYLDDVYLASRRREYTFDTVIGLVLSAVSQYEQLWPSRSSTMRKDGILRLVRNSVLPPRELDSLHLDAGQYFSVRKQYDRIMSELSHDHVMAERRLDEAEDVLLRFAAIVRSEFIRRRVAKRLALHRSEYPFLVADARQQRRLLDTASATWVKTDLDGVIHQGDCTLSHLPSKTFSR